MSYEISQDPLLGSHHLQEGQPQELRSVSQAAEGMLEKEPTWITRLPHVWLQKTQGSASKIVLNTLSYKHFLYLRFS